MGLFGSKKTYVSSTVQNMAGDELKRPNYLKTSVIGSILANQESVADTLQRAYLKGPGMKLRSFFRWSGGDFTDFDEVVGLPKARIGGVVDLDGYVIGTQIPVDPGQSVNVQSSEAGLADYSYWAEKYIMDNALDDLDSDWSADMNEATGQITITWEDESVTSFTPADFDKDSTYIYAAYMTTESGDEGPVVTGSLIDIDDGAFPSTSGWSTLSTSTTPTAVTRTKTTTIDSTFSDGSTPEHSSSSESIPDSYDVYNGVFQREVYQGTDTSLLSEDRTYKNVETMYLFQTAHLTTVSTTTTTTSTTGGVTKTTTTVVNEEVITYDRSYRIDTQEVTVKKWRGPFMFIYRVGSGNAILDGLAADDSTEIEGEFFPAIPIRVDNEFLSEDYEPDAYRVSKKAFKKAVDGKMDKVIDELSDAESLDDIDYVYAVFGVSVNVIENACRKYMYRFFKQLSDSQSTEFADYETWLTDMDTFQTSLSDWLEWKQNQGDPLDGDFGSDEPTIAAYPVLPTSRLTLESHGTMESKYKVELSWQSITELSGSSLAKPGAKKGELWFETTSEHLVSDKIYYDKTLTTVKDKQIDAIRLYWQVDEDSWKALDIVGLIHKNFVYKKKYVETTLREGLDDTEDSGFIVPLHYPTYKSMSIVDSTQMSTACTFLVFNSYVIKKTGLLGSLFFKILLIIVIIIVIVYAPQLAPQLVSAASATGAAVGLTGVTALVVGAAINAIAAMILTSLIMKASIAVFGRKLGMIIGTIVSIVAVNGLNNLANGQGFTINFGNMMSAQNLTMLTSATGNVYAKFIMYDAMDTMENMQELEDTYKQKMKDISKLYAETLGYGNGVIDPLALLDSSNMLIESASTFFTRTLMTGSDIAEMSMGMIEAFPEITLSTDLPLDN